MIPVPRLWPGATVAILAGGPSLTQSDVDLVAAADCRVIAIKDTIRLHPDADLLYACDGKWWKFHQPTYAGPRYALSADAAPFATVLKNTGETGLELDPSGLRTGKNSGYQSIGLAVHLGAARIVLLGYDMKPLKGAHHWFGRHPYPTADLPYEPWLRLFKTIVEPLAAAGVQVVNATPGSALDIFPRVTLAEALEGVAA